MNGDLRVLGDILFDYINDKYYMPSDANYCYIDTVTVHYDENVALTYDLCVKWGRNYNEVDKSKTHLNEDRTTILQAAFELNNPYVILGQFIQAIKDL